MASEAQAIAIQQYLTFRLDNEVFGVDVAQVREVLDHTDITRVPQMPDYMLGVINLRGSVVPVVDLRRKFGVTAKAADQNTCIIVLDVLMNDEPTVIGALADAVNEVLDLPAAAIEPPPRMGTKLRTEFIRGMGKKDEQFIIILDIDRIFSAEELVAIQDRDEPHAKVG